MMQMAAESEGGIFYYFSEKFLRELGVRAKFEVYGLHTGGTGLNASSAIGKPNNDDSHGVCRNTNSDGNDDSYKTEEVSLPNEGESGKELIGNEEEKQVESDGTSNRAGKSAAADESNSDSKSSIDTLEVQKL
jgi:hypothetical protein